MVIYFFYTIGSFWGEKQLTASLFDDGYTMNLVMFKNNHYTIKTENMLETFNFFGAYSLKGDTIEFDRFPVIENEFLPKKIIRKGDKIYFTKNNQGRCDIDFQYFKINYENNNIIR